MTAHTLIPQAEGSDYFEAPLQGGASWSFFLEHLHDEEVTLAILDGLEFLVVDLASPHGWEECEDEDWNTLLLDWMGDKPPFSSAVEFWEALNPALELQLDFPDDQLPYQPMEAYRRLEWEVPMLVQDAFLHLYDKWCSTARHFTQMMMYL